MEQPNPLPPQGVTTGNQPVFDTQRGSTLYTSPTERTVKCYPVLETELKSVSMYNTLVAVCFSVASGLFSFGLGLLINAFILGNVAGTSAALVWLILVLCVVLALVFVIGGIWAWCNRRSEWKRIVQESKVRVVS